MEKMSLHLKMMLIICAITLLTSGIGTTLYIKNFKQNYLEAIEWRSVSLTQSISVDLRNKYKYFHNLADPTLLIESAYLHCKKLHEANRNMHVVFVALLDSKGGIITHNDKNFWGQSFKSPTITKALQEMQVTTILVDQTYHTLIPVLDEKQTLLVTIDVGFPLNVVRQKIMGTIRTVIVSSLFLYLCAFFLVWLFIKRIVSKPIKRLIETTEAIAAGNLDTEVYLEQTKEFKHLSLGLTHLRDSIKQSLKEIEGKNQEVSALIACSPVALCSTDLQGHVSIWTQSAEQMFGWKQDEVLGKGLPFFPNGQKKSFQEHSSGILQGNVLLEEDMLYRQKDGSLLYGSLSLAPIRDSEGAIIGIMAAIQDVSERIEREKTHQEVQEQLVQAQKLESVGRLAGGVAHDYNNMLGVILGYAEMLKKNISEKDKKYEYIQEITKAATRSAEITRQLLTFARKQTISPRRIDLNECVKNMLLMLHRLIGEDIQLTWIPQEQLAPVLMDATQVDQILANLCINSKDAMENGGQITIETRSATIDREYFGSQIGFKSGSFVCLSVSDNGIGMDKELQESIFDPFFTTKERGKGTGLGLATIYGIIKQNNGFIHVYSEPGKGATFNIYFPECEGAKESIESPSTPSTCRGNKESILVVEDEASILKMSQKMLEQNNYTVITAQNPDDAIIAANTRQDEIRLLVTDVILPGMNGRELAEKLQTIIPGLKVLYMSGYTANVIAHHGVLDKDIHFLQKPFSRNDLTEKVKNALET